MCATLRQFHFHPMLRAENSHSEIAQTLWRTDGFLNDFSGFLLHRNTVLHRTRTKSCKRFTVKFSHA
jgi:hypothetical protein